MSQPSPPIPRKQSVQTYCSRSAARSAQIKNAAATERGWQALNNETAERS